MTEEEKAWELMEKYIEQLLDVGLYRDDVKNNALRCAEIAVDEMLKTNWINVWEKDYWEEVKRHLSLL